ncbi:thioredoxin domain-containing protein [Thermogemmatispora onikobensis]|uniref:thioredoxin domain-containing protein n=1 Tax=Thermogemmatispora onikobensis TaxID=732234 RepID=UPI00085308EB|nr:thioredoxin domain-containing protein [Thermogemmatispora onikobensis]
MTEASGAPQGAQHTNRLIHETSPYLLQHAHNPVDWYPWGEEALNKARQEDKPIFLSIGYSACHWCHVMERESFENAEIAALINRYFVPIKVDREERPDLDAIYMQAIQALTGQGGWPLNVFLTPDGRPFFGGTYFPPEDRRYGGQVMAGFPRVLLTIVDAYQNRRQEVEEQAERLAEYLRERSSAPLLRRGQGQVLPQLEQLANAARELAAEFDPVNGGFGGAPKFPNSMALEFLLRVHLHRASGELPAVKEGERSELEMVEQTLQRMACGGIYDQLGGGFHRYSVDARWLVPHFEKMLYDNALLSRLYLHAYLVTGNPFYRRIAEETLDYVMREMTAPEGGFYSTQDADSEGEEGKFYLWQAEEIARLLPGEDGDLFMAWYGVTPRGNFEGKNILHVPEPDAQRVAERLGVSRERLEQALEKGRALLLAAREQRVKPGRDEKVLTAWNGLMLRSFAEAARYLGRSDYRQVAERNADFLLATLRKNGRLQRTWKDGRAHLAGYLEDYAFLADGLLALYEASFELRWFSEARSLIEEALQLFADSENGGFFDTGSDQEALVSRPKEIMDNATPAGNSVAAEVLLRLAAFTGEERYHQAAESYLQALADIMTQHPHAFGHLLGALDFALSPGREIAIIGDPQAEETAALLAVVNSHYRPNSVLACVAPGSVQERAAALIPLLAERPQQNGRATAYVCQHFACQAPVTTAEELQAQLGELDH